MSILRAEELNERVMYAEASHALGRERGVLHGRIRDKAGIRSMPN